MFGFIFVINSANYFGILIHLLMRLSNHESVFSLTGKDQELDSFFFSSLGFTMVCNHLSTLCSLTLISENMFCFINVSKMLKVQSYHIFIVIGSFISFFSLFVVLFCFFGFSNQNKNLWGANFVHERSCRCEILYLNIDTSCFFNKISLLIKLSCFLPLFHLFTNTSNLNDKVLFLYIFSYVKSSLDVTHSDCSSGNTSMT